MSAESEMFDQAGGGKFDPEGLNGCLLVIWPSALEEDVPTTFGASDAIRATVLIVDGPQAGEVIEDALIFPKVLVSNLRSKVGRQVLGRLSQGIAKPSQDPPWIIVPFDDDDVALAVPAVQAYKSGQFAQPEEAPAAPAKSAPAKPSPAAAKPAPKAAPAAPAAVAVPADKVALAKTLLGSGVPVEAIEQSTGFSAKDLAAAGVDGIPF